MKRLLECAEDILITEDVLLTAARLCPRDGLIKMFCGRSWKMTEEVLGAIMSHLGSKGTLQLVLDRRKDREVTGNSASSG